MIRTTVGSGGAGAAGVSSGFGATYQDTIFQYPSSLAHRSAMEVSFLAPAMRKVAPKCWPYSRGRFVGAPGVSRLAQSNLAARSSGMS